MSNAASAATTVTVRHTPISYRTPGIVTARSSANHPAPSILAASYSEASILLMAVTSNTVQNPSSTQTPIMPTAGRAQSKSPSQARVRLSSPIASSAWLTSPDSDSNQPQMMPAATSGITWGRNRTVRATDPNRPLTTRWITLAATSPRTTGMKLKNTTNRNEL